MSVLCCAPSKLIIPAAAYACVRAAATVPPVPVTDRMRPPFVTSAPSRTAVPPWKTSAPLASAAAIPSIAAPA